jgi:hypothetical protein
VKWFVAEKKSGLEENALREMSKDKVAWHAY